MRIVDAQIHLWQNDQAPPHHWRAPFRIEDALRQMDEAGVERAINCPPHWDPHSNEYAVEAARAHPDRFATLGWFNLDRAPDASFLEGWLGQPGMLGLRFLFFTPLQQQLFTSGQLDWLWESADRLGISVALGVVPGLLGPIELLAQRFPRIRLHIDHLGVGPFSKLPEAFEHLDALLCLARHPNVAVKATAVPSMAYDCYPFPSTHPYLRRIFDAFGPHRMFWGTDFTRMHCDWRECITMFTESLNWLSGNDLEQVMGRAVCDWVGWC